MIWIIGLAGSLGAALRFLLSQITMKRIGMLAGFPLATWLINMTGSFALGLLANLHMMNLVSHSTWLIFGVGFCGAFTTLSTFGYELMTLIQANKLGIALLYMTTSLLLGILFAAIGLLI